MKLAVINGSPRGKKSNSNFIIRWMFETMPDDFQHDVFYASETQKHAQIIEGLAAYDAYLIIFPMYTDAMPGIVKAFFEGMAERKGSFTGKNVYFIVHSGFPEAAQSRTVLAYCKHFAGLMGMRCVSAVPKGGSEGIRQFPEHFQKKLAARFARLGEDIAAGHPLDAQTVSGLSQMQRLNVFARLVMKLIPMNDFFWNSVLKRNGAYESRRARPLL